MGTLSSSANAVRRSVKVLCFYRAWARVRGSTVQWTDSIMIDVEKSDEIESRFRSEMKIRFHGPRLGCQVGPTPSTFELLSFLTENGRESFNIYRDR